MKDVKMATLPKCDECKTNDAMYDAPACKYGRSWGYWCETCAKKVDADLLPASKLVQHTPAEAKGGKPKLAKELSDMEAVVMDGEREVECPDCGCIRRVEPDADYEFDCEDCGIRLKCASIM